MIGSHSIARSARPALALRYVLLVLCVSWLTGGARAEENPVTVLNLKKH